ncbi:open rectifier potassium channel protein 1-like isoform X2 [Portunus trituberculatus]|uniref:open rectifier potassium channel protein 1-like isoform X2 n=1 Tax=Portunus trituberculatus TaxID=210409 RepID=UPI001E1CDACF|nr:open rectifier potassium channel protein 1-like isoform X2 [Portunus trituberculatus]
MASVNSLVLCIVYTLFLVFGGLIFKFLEYEVEDKVHITEPPEWTRLKDLALQEDPPADEDQLLSLAPWLPRACPELSAATVNALVTRGSQAEAVMEVEAACPHLHYENVTQEVVYAWSFIDALYFSMTVTTTIGYGHLTPSGSWSRIVCILYSLVGIPLTGMLLAWTSNFFGDKLLQLFKSRLSDEKQHSHTFIAAATVIYITLGFVVFIFLPSALFSSLEGWSYLTAVYYSYITLTTIGFGDYVTGNELEGSKLYAYQIGVILWIMVGLGYWVMVANFITKALKSKRLTASMKRRAEEMKKLMQQVGVKNHDPAFLRQHSKATVNLMLQLSNVLAVQDMGNDEAAEMEGTSDTTDTVTTGPSSPSAYSPTLSPGGIPGISSLFGAGLSHNTPLSHLMGPLRREDHGEKKNTEEYTEVTVSLI